MALAAKAGLAEPFPMGERRCLSHMERPCVEPVNFEYVALLASASPAYVKSEIDENSDGCKAGR